MSAVVATTPFPVASIEALSFEPKRKNRFPPSVESVGTWTSELENALSQDGKNRFEEFIYYYICAVNRDEMTNGIS